MTIDKLKTQLNPGDLIFKQSQEFIHKLSLSGGSVGLFHHADIVMIVGDHSNTDYFQVLHKEQLVYLSKETCYNNFTLLEQL